MSDHKKLTDFERIEFTIRTKIIIEGLSTFCDVGASFATILEKEWYLATSDSFEKYLQEQWVACEKHSHTLHLAILPFIEILPGNTSACECESDSGDH